MTAQLQLAWDRDNGEQLGRVSSRIAKAILKFAQIRLDGREPDFMADDLRDFVERNVGPTAPGSADRILRDLRQRGLVKYEVLSRKDSLYRLSGAPR